MVIRSKRKTLNALLYLPGKTDILKISAVIILPVIALILIQIFFVTGCGLRDVEDPVTSRTTFVPPTSPDLVIINLQYSVIERDVNNYLQCFVDTSYSPRRYFYTADVSSQIQYPIFRLWNMQNEKTYYTSLISLTNPESNSNLFFTNPTLNTFGDTAVYDADYLLRFDHQKTTVAKTLTGKIRLILGADTRNLWSVHRWIDIKASSADTTWSVLKANFSN